MIYSLVKFVAVCQVTAAQTTRVPPNAPLISTPAPLLEAASRPLNAIEAIPVATEEEQTNTEAKPTTDEYPIPDLAKESTTEEYATPMEAMSTKDYPVPIADDVAESMVEPVLAPTPDAGQVDMVETEAAPKTDAEIADSNVPAATEPIIVNEPAVEENNAVDVETEFAPATDAEIAEPNAPADASSEEEDHDHDGDGVQDHTAEEHDDAEIEDMTEQIMNKEDTAEEGDAKEMSEDDMSMEEGDEMEEDASAEEGDEMEEDTSAVLTGPLPRDWSEYATDKQNEDDFETIDLALNEADSEYGRFFLVDGAKRCSSTNGALPLKRIVKLDEQRFAKGNCNHICATPEENEPECYGYSEDKDGHCELYLEAVSTFQGLSAENDDGEFEGIQCYIKGISCGGHMAINCEHCPTKGSEHPEMECNGQCIYDYEILQESEMVLGACRGRTEEETDDTLTDCGAHKADTCATCATRYTFECKGGERYCHGDCSWEAGDCLVCPEETTTTTTTTEAPSTTIAPEVTTTTIAPEVIVEPVQELGTTGDEDEVDGFNGETASNQMDRFR